MKTKRSWFCYGLLASALGWFNAVGGSQETILHNFAGGTNDGANSVSSLTLSGATLYGMTQEGGSYGFGTVFSIHTNGTGYTILHNFTNGSDGGGPVGNLTLSGGMLFGTTTSGGSNFWGTVFSLNTNGTGCTTLHNFAGSPSDGGFAISLTLSGGTLYGMTTQGGSNNNGVVFSINTNGVGFNVLHAFNGGSDGAGPLGSPTLSGGMLYGMTPQGGSNNNGVVFNISANGTGFTSLYNFASSPGDGSFPESALTLSGGTLYGITCNGGSNNDGVVFALALSATVTVAANPVNGGSVVGGGLYGSGNNIQIAATASNNWLFTSWNTGATNNPYTITVPATNITYTANFAAAAKITVSDNTNVGGIVTGSGTFLIGSTNGITATPSNNWVFLRWNDGVTNNSRQIVVVSNVTYTAIFASVATITVLASPTNGGSVTGGGTYLSGTNITLRAMASNSWLFTSWNTGATNNPYTITVPTTNITYTANFAATATVSVVASPSNHGSVQGGGTFFVGSNVTLTATASNGWLLAHWNDGNTSTTRTITVPPTNITYTATFGSSVVVTVQSASNLFGTVTGGGSYAVGGTASISAAANLSWRFLRWSDGNTTNARSILVASNITLTANFTNAAHIYMQDQAGNVTKWAINNTNTLQQYATFGGMGAWILKAAGDMNLDCKADLFWQQTNGPNGCVVAYLSQTNGSYNGVGLGNMGAWALSAAADVDGDGIADLIWQHSAGWVSIWCMNSNCTQSTSASLGNMGVWKLKGAGDINKDGKADLIWQSPMGDVVVWLSQPGGGYQGLGVGNLGAWELRAVHDVDGDGIADLLWQNPGGWTVAWYMTTNGTVRAGVGLGNIFVGTTTNKIMAVE